jgi:hypothetical protein
MGLGQANRTTLPLELSEEYWCIHIRVQASNTLVYECLGAPPTVPEVLSRPKVAPISAALVLLSASTA